jgi:uncharacterized membrane protein
VLGVVLFLGNLIVTAVWKVLADRTRQVDVIAYAQRLVAVTDIAFTAPGAILIAVSGGVLAGDVGGVTGPGWLTTGLVLFALSGVIWLTILVPTQVRQTRLARRFKQEATVPDQYWRLALLWYVFGSIATVLPLANVFIMTVKP